MKQNSQQIVQIESYLKGELSDLEAKAFEAKMAKDPLFQEAVNKFRFQQEILEYLLEKDLRKKMQGWKENPLTVVEKSTSRNVQLWWLAAAAVLTATTLTLFYFFRNPSSTTPPLVQENKGNKDSIAPQLNYDSTSAPQIKQPNLNTKIPSNAIALAYQKLAITNYVKPLSLEGKLMGLETTSAVNRVSEAYQAYRKQEYQKIIQLLEGLSESEFIDQYSLGLKLLGHAYFQTEHYPNAASTFRALRNRSNDPVVVEEAEWYLLLSLVPDYSKSQLEIEDLLQKMIKPENEHAFGQEAKQVQIKLDALKKSE